MPTQQIATDMHACPGKTGSRLFDTLGLARSTETVVCRGDKRKYYGFWVTPQNYSAGVATGYAVGCGLRCVFCWANETRDNAEQGSDFYSPEEVFERLSALVAAKKGLDMVRISNGEPTIGKEHLLKVLELIEKSEIREFVLETNGILLGHDEDLVKSLAKFKKLYVRLSLKAGTPEAFSRKTGATPDGFELQFQGIRNLMKHKVRTGVAAMSADPRFMPPLERVSLIGKLAAIDPALVLALEEEMTVLFPTTQKRLDSDGWDYSNVRTSRIVRYVPFLQKFVQYSYEPVSSLKRQKVSLRYTMKAIRELFYGI
jgi:uncharacterized Fe-S cluster-containing radical SAM superfamily protein